VVLYDWIFKKMESKRLLHPLESKRRYAVVWGTLLILILAVVLPKTLKPQRYERLPEKWSGIWIKNQYGRGMTIFTTVHRVAYYADGNLEYIDLNKDTFDKVKDLMIGEGALYLAIRERESIGFLENAEAIKRNFVEVIRFGGKGMEQIIVYKRVN
jgi:hypothetical protein